MAKATVSRRAVLKGAPYALAAAAGIPPGASGHAASGLSPRNDETIRKWYAAWEKKDWGPVDALLADDFTFTSAAGDDHISKSAFKTQCWQTQIDFIDRFELQHVIGSGREAFVMYVCRTKNGNMFRNVEYLRLKGGKLESIECYFGAQSSFASAVGSGQS
jgi:ketosteroid isomerase-like protein